MWTLVAVAGGFVVVFIGLVLFASTRRPVAEQRAAKRLQVDDELRLEGVTPVGDAPWLLNWAGGDEYSLKNVGDATLRSLQVVAVDPLHQITTDAWTAELEPEAVQSFHVLADGAPEPRVMVTWRDDDDIHVKSWTTALPGE